ncbi:hypothetical protein RB597_007776 [Gaeumannomyces tritici]
MASLNDPPPLDLAATLAALPPLTASNPRAEIRKVLASGGSKIPILVVLDDDPTGTQTCHGIPVLAVWNEAALAAEFRRTGPGSGFFILTNSRALHPAPARDLITEICTNLMAAAASAGGVSFEVVLRGDSTLRGHFSLECDAASAVLGRPDATHGRRYLFRTGAAFVSSRLGISPIPPVTAAQLGFARGGAGGLVIAGSYVPKTTAQLEALTRRSGDALTTIVLDVEKLLEEKGVASKSVSGEVRRAIEQAEREITRGQDVLVMTSRKLIVGSDAARSLDIGSAVAAALVSFLVNLDTRPRYIIAKGGITSSDMATKGLRFKRAEIVGQAAAGVPLWRCDEPESKWAGIPYVVFPGNVGAADTLFDVVSGWRVS